MNNGNSQVQRVFGSFDRWLVFVLVSLNYFVLYLHRTLVNFLQPSLIESLELSEVQLGSLQTAFLLPYTFSQIFVGYLGDRFPRRYVILGSLSGSFVALAGMGVATSYEQLLILRICLGVSQAASVPAIASVMADCFTPKNRSTAISLYLFSYNCALVVGGYIGGSIADTPTWTLPFSLSGGSPTTVDGWRMAFFIFAGVGLVVALTLFFFFREPPRTEREEDKGLGAGGASLFATLKAVLTVRSYLAIAFAFVLVCVVINTKEFWLTRYFHDRMGMDQGDAGWFSTFWIQCGTMAGLLLGGVLADLWARKSQGGRTAVQIIGLGLWVPTLIVMGLSESHFLLIAVMLTFGLGTGFYQANLWTTTFEVVDPAARATAIGLLNVASMAASGSAPLIGSFYEHTSKTDELGMVFVGLGVASAVIAGLLLLSVQFLLPHDYRGPLKEP